MIWPRLRASAPAQSATGGHPRLDTGNGAPGQAVILTSPHAGSAAQLNRARAAMINDGFTILAEIPITQHQRLAHWVSGPGALLPLIVAAGGDGTVGAAANYVANIGAVLGVLPLGTSNDFARSLGIPTHPLRAARLLSRGKIATIDTGRLTVAGQPARHFVHAATVGFSVSFARLATKASLRQRFGRLTYAVAAVNALRRRESFDCELSYDGHVEHLRLVHLSVINAPVFGGFLGLRVRGATLDDRRLDVIAVEDPLSVRRLLIAALQPVWGRTGPVRGIRALQVRRLELFAGQQLDVALDGEIQATLPASFDVAGEALRVITPPGFDDIDD